MSKIVKGIIIFSFFPFLGLAENLALDDGPVTKVSLSTSSWKLTVTRSGEAYLGFGSNLEVPVKSGVFDFGPLVKKLSSFSYELSSISDFTDKGNPNYVSVGYWKERQITADVVYVKNEDVIDVFEKAMRNVIVYKSREFSYDRAMRKNPPLGLKIERKKNSEEDLKKHLEVQKKFTSDRINKIKNYEKKVEYKRGEEVIVKKPVTKKNSPDWLLWVVGALIVMSLGILMRVKLQES